MSFKKLLYKMSALISLLGKRKNRDFDEQKSAINAHPSITYDKSILLENIDDPLIDVSLTDNKSILLENIDLLLTDKEILLSNTELELDGRKLNYITKYINIYTRNNKKVIGYCISTYNKGLYHLVHILNIDKITESNTIYKIKSINASSMKTGCYYFNTSTSNVETICKVKKGIPLSRLMLEYMNFEWINTDKKIELLIEKHNNIVILSECKHKDHPLAIDNYPYKFRQTSVDKVICNLNYAKATNIIYKKTNNILYLDSLNLVTTKTLLKRVPLLENKNLHNVNVNDDVIHIINESKLSVPFHTCMQCFLNNNYKNKYASVWLDYNSTLRGNSQICLISDIELLFKNNMVLNNGLLAITFIFGRKTEKGSSVIRSNKYDLIISKIANDNNINIVNLKEYEHVYSTSATKMNGHVIFKIYKITTKN